MSVMIGIVGLPTAAIAQEYVPPDRGLPGRREGGGTRGGCPTSQPPMTALMPSTNFGQTVSDYPTFFWYVPPRTAEVAEFVLLDDNDNEVYKTIIQLTGESGIVSLTLPAVGNTSPLEIGRDYHWYFSLVCDPLDRSGDSFAEGWIQHIELDPNLENQLIMAASSDHPALYAEAGIWYDAVASLAELRRSQPDNSALLFKWSMLLESVDLNAIASQPLISCCEPISIESEAFDVLQSNR
jgi:Domain of Unknown Function (DUF928)